MRNAKCVMEATAVTITNYALHKKIPNVLNVGEIFFNVLASQVHVQACELFRAVPEFFSATLAV